MHVMVHLDLSLPTAYFRLFLHFACQQCLDYGRIKTQGESIVSKNSAASRAHRVMTHTLQSKFLGNSVATVMEGENRVRLLDRLEDGEYHLTVRPLNSFIWLI